MAYTDNEFYTTTYHGDTIPVSSFDKYAEKSSAKLDIFTRGQIADISAHTEDIQTKIKKAMCSLADIMYEFDMQMLKANTQDDGNVKSKSSGNESITYQTVDTKLVKAMADSKAENDLYYQAIRDYLFDTGLLYWGC